MKGTGIELTTILFVVFLILKLMGYIDWSWWWVTSPLWIPYIIDICVLIFVGIILGIKKIFF